MRHSANAATAATSGNDAAESSVAGHIFAADQPQPEATVMVVAGSAGHPDIAALSNETGEYQLGGLAAGCYTIEARLGNRTLRREVELVAGETTRLDFMFD